MCMRSMLMYYVATSLLTYYVKDKMEIVHVVLTYEIVLC